MIINATHWHDQIQLYRDAYKDKFESPGRDVVNRYRDESTSIDKDEIGTRFNILWSNVSILKPATYSKPPKPEAYRRFKDKNPAARVASLMLERCLSYEITQYSDYDSALSNSVMDRLLPGRGISWVRYEPTIESISEDKEQVTGERSPCDYVYWLDFAHDPARTWEEVTWVARRVYTTRDEGLARFGEVFRNVPLTNNPYSKDDERHKTVSDDYKKAKVWEIWDKGQKKVYWVAEDFDTLLDEKPDPLELGSFFPCPKPLYATITTDCLVPRNDYSRYQDLAVELERITRRIARLTEQIKIRGAYAADMQDFKQILSQDDGGLVPITNWARLADNGGIKGGYELVDITPMIAALAQMYQAREQIKQTIYEITGISDIVRGASEATETATAQQIKSQYASVRLSEMKSDVARFAKELLCLKAEIMCGKYQDETLVKMSGVEYIPEAQENPAIIQEAIALLRDDVLRNFAIDIQNDSLVELDKRGEQQSRIEFLGAIGGFLEKALMTTQQMPDMVPLVGELMLFAVRGFDVGQTLEGTFESVFDQAKDKAKQGQPDSAEIQAQYDQKMQQMQEQMQAQMQDVVAGMQEKHQSELDAALDKAGIERERLDIEREKEQNRLNEAEASRRHDLLKLKISKNDDDSVSIDDETGEESVSPKFQALLEQMAANNQQIISAMVQSNAMLAEAIAKEISRPKKLVRGSDGSKMSIPIIEE